MEIQDTELGLWGKVNEAYTAIHALITLLPYYPITLLPYFPISLYFLPAKMSFKYEKLYFCDLIQDVWAI
jgi:hypothetical protein